MEAKRNMVVDESHFAGDSSHLHHFFVYRPIELLVLTSYL